MATKNTNKAVVRTPLELQLQKINLSNLTQQKNIQVQYQLLRLLDEITDKAPELVNSEIFTKLFNILLDFQQVEALKKLPLFENFSYRLWNNQKFNYEVREKTSFYKIVSNWIVSFQLKSGNLTTLESQFELISNFMAKQTTSVLQRIVMIEEIFEDLKDFIDKQFWLAEEQWLQADKAKGQGKSVKQSFDERTNSIQRVLEVIEAIINPIFYRINTKISTYKNCTYGNFAFRNTQILLKHAIFYVLSHLNIPSHIQTQVSKIALIYLQSLGKEQANEIVKMLRFMMVGTSKPVRFALVVQYVQFYQYLQMMGFEEVIEELQGLVYFRQLIIGRKMVEENLRQLGNVMNELNLSYHELYIKAGTSKKVYFSSENQQNILKLDIILEENDINLSVTYLDAIKLSKGNKLNKIVMETVERLNQYDASKLQGSKMYWKEDRSTSKKLQLRLQHQGLYCIQFDNSYSWVIPKNIKYRLQIYQLFK